jgi:hypothetical protein
MRNNVKPLCQTSIALGEPITHHNNIECVEEGKYNVKKDK